MSPCTSFPRYVQVNTWAMSLVKPGGLLLTCSCSAAVTQSNSLLSVVTDAAAAGRRDVTILAQSSTGGDHPVHLGYAEGSYLTAILMRIL